MAVLEAFCAALLLLTLSETPRATAAEGESPKFLTTFKQRYGVPTSPPVQSSADVVTMYLRQPLNHFDVGNMETWLMRFMANQEFHVPGGPIFIFVGGTWPIESSLITGGHFYDMAREHKAALYITEHRYYGQSWPTRDLAVENLQYMGVEQTLADLAGFIDAIRKTLPGGVNAKVLLAGGFYAGALVTWFQQLYPGVAVGSWASSAPLQAQFDYREYKELVGDSIKLLDFEGCYSRIRSGIWEMEDMLANRRAAEVKAMLQMCNNFNEMNPLDVSSLFSQIADIFAAVVQTHSGWETQEMCNILRYGSSDANGIAHFVLRVFNTTGCNDLSYKTLRANYEQITYDANVAGTRQLLYQSCNEFGLYQTTNSRRQPFGTKVSQDLFTTLCRDVFGEQFTAASIEQRVEDTNARFGGLQPFNETNVYFTQGQLDPWRGAGVQDARATIVPSYAHCKDFYSLSASDSLEMRAAKENIAELARIWLS